VGNHFRLQSLSEPLTPASSPETTKWAKCDAYKQVVSQIRRYSLGELSGQSILLAGHIGAGKTTLDHLAIEEVQTEAATASTPDAGAGDFSTRPSSLRKLLARIRAVLRRAPASPKGGPQNAPPIPGWPFLVTVHGPDLLHDVSSADRDPEPDGDDMARDALRQIAKALHRSLCREVGRRYHEFALEKADPNLIEASHEFMRHLDRAPSAQDLRAHYELAGILKDGLFPHRQRDGKRRHPEGQGWCELFALTTAVDAAQIIVQAEDDEAREKEGGAPQGHASSDDRPSHLLPGANRLREIFISIAPAISLAAGGLVGYGSYSSIKDIFGAGLIAAATAALTFFFLRYASQPTQDPTLLPRPEIPELDRLLPHLVERILDASLVPVFVIDELDKVDRLDRKLERLIKGAKSFIADSALFIFLTDRDYYERVRAKIRQNPGYGVETTFFSERVLISFTPLDIDLHLKDALQWEAPPGSSDVQSELAPFWLRLHSKLHAGELRRFLLSNTEDAKLVLPEVGTSGAGRGFVLATYAQIAIELVFEDARVQRRLRLSPELSQPVLDTLYYPVREWLADPSKANVLGISKDELQRHLEERIFGVRTGFSGITDADLTFLLDDVLKPLVEHLQTEPARVYDLAITAKLGRNRAMELPDFKDELIRHPYCLLGNPVVEGTYPWRFNAYGEPLTEEARRDVERGRVLGGSLGPQRRVVALLASLVKRLADHGQSIPEFCNSLVAGFPKLDDPSEALDLVAKYYLGNLKEDDPKLPESVTLIREWEVSLCEVKMGLEGVALRVAIAFAILYRNQSPCSAISEFRPAGNFPWDLEAAQAAQIEEFPRLLGTVPEGLAAVRENLDRGLRLRSLELSLGLMLQADCGLRR